MSNNNNIHTRMDSADQDQETLFHSYPCAYYVQSPSTISHANSADFKTNNLLESSFLPSPSRSDTIVVLNKNPEATRFTLSRYSSSHGSNNSFLNDKKIIINGGAAEISHGGVNRLVIVDDHHHGHGASVAGHGMEDDDDDDDDDEEEEYYHGRKGGWWWRYCSFRRSSSNLWISLQVTWRILLSLAIALLVFYIAAKPPAPKISIKRIEYISRTKQLARKEYEIGGFIVCKDKTTLFGPGGQPSERIIALPFGPSYQDYEGQVAVHGQTPRIGSQSAANYSLGFSQFGLAEGVDSYGVTTKILTCNCSVNLFIKNKSKLFGLHIHPPFLEMAFGRLPFAMSRGPKLYTESHSSTVFKLSVGTRNKPMYGAGRNMQDMLESGNGLPLVIRASIRSNFRVVWDLIKTKFHHQAECLLVLDRAYEMKRRTQAYKSTCRIH